MTKVREIINLSHGYPLFDISFRHTESMNDLNWIQDIQWQDVTESYDHLDLEAVYTLYRTDFRRIPTIDYSELAELDPHLQALLN